MSLRVAPYLLIVGLFGCPCPQAVCTMPKHLLAEDLFRPEDWYRLLVSRGLDGSPCDCMGRPVEWQVPATFCREAQTTPAPLPAAPFSASDLIISPVGDDDHLVWVLTQRYEDGSALGPVALVRGRRHRPQVLVTGTLRARPARVQLSLVTLGQQTFLAADGESCPGDDPGACRRSTVLLARRDSLFASMSLVDENGACVGPAEIYQARSEVVHLSSAARRRFDLSSTLAFDGDRIIVQETVTVSDLGPLKTATPRLERRADAERIVRIAGERLIVHESSLWSRVVQNGSR